MSTITRSPQRHTDSALRVWQVATACLLALSLFMASLILAHSGSANSDWVKPIKDFSGTVQVVNNDGTQVAVDTSSGQVASQVLNTVQFRLHQGDQIEGTLVDLGDQDGIIVHSVH